jgi:hypothetical protein
MGGKRRLADRVIPLFPAHECYVEVFADDAALYFMRPQAAPVEVLNDINGDLVTLYRVVQNHLEEFVRQFKWALSSQQVFEWQKMTRPKTLTDIQRAARFFYNGGLIHDLERQDLTGIVAKGDSDVDIADALWKIGTKQDTSELNDQVVGIATASSRRSCVRGDGREYCF